MRTVKPIVWFVMSLAALFAAACGDNKSPAELTLDPSSLTVMVGEDATIQAQRGSDELTAVTWQSSDGTVARVTPGAGGSATVRGLAVGRATVTATIDGVSATAEVTVTAATLESIAITPPDPSLAAGTSTQLTATGTYSDGTTADLSATATWSSATPSVATVSATGELTGVAVGTSVITAAVGGVSGTTTATVTAANLVAIDVTPTDPSLARGTTVQLTATGRFSDLTTQDLTTQVTWASATTTTATVSAGGLVTGVNTGTSVVSATMGAVSGSVTVTVTPAVLTAIDVTPTNPSIADGLTQQFTATGRFSDMTTQNLTTMVTWSSGTAATATITAGGLATAVNPGTSVITATSGTISGSTTLTVTAAALVSIAVTPTNPSIADGLTQQFTATGTFTDATTANLTTTVTWTSGTPATATISNAAGSQGLATAVNPGTSVITATSGTISGSTTLTVTPAALVSIQVTPVNPSLVDGLTQQFTATGTFTDATTANITDTVTWSSGTTAVATISNAAGSRGLATGVSPGTSVITATSGTISGTTTLTVTDAQLVSIVVTPAAATISLGTTRQFTATGHYTDATTADLTDTVTWASSDATVATISNAAGSRGLATSVAVGTTTISATSGTIVGSTTLAVSGATLVSIAVTAASASLPDGLSQPYTAIGTYSDTTTADITTQVTWASSNTAVAQISNAAGTEGVATAVDPGTTTISATSGTIVGSAPLTVTPAVLVSIAVTPANPSIAKGRVQAFTATGTYSDASTQPLTTAVTWASSDITVAQISNAAGTEGQATAIVEGTTTISATLGAVSGSTSLTVVAAELVSIAVTPAAPSVAKGRTQAFVATGTYSDTSTQVLTASVTWASSDATVATISNTPPDNGLATTLLEGTTTISATLGAITGSTTLTVTAAELVSIAVTPAAPTINPTETLPLTATGTFTDASTQNVTATAVWTSTADTVATVSTTGVVTGVAGGTADIRATIGAISGVTTVTVRPRPTVVGIQPADGLRGVRANAAIAVTFSVAMDATSLTGQTANGPCTGSIQLSGDDFTSCLGFTSATPVVAVNTAAFQPAAALTTLATYKVRVDASVRSAAGVTMGTTLTQVSGFTVATDGVCGATLMISGVYGAGGNAGATLNADYVELHNPGLTPVALGGMALQYASATGNSWQATPLPSVSVPAGGYFTVRVSTVGTNGAAFTADHVALPAIAMAATAGKVALTPYTTAIPTGTVCPIAATLDFVGYGTTANCFEGTAATPAPSTTLAVFRAGAGCTDANANNTDFATALPAPRTGATAPLVCQCTANETNTVAEIDFCNLQFPTAMTVAAGVTTPLVYGRVFENGLTQPPGAHPQIVADLGFGPTGVNPATMPGFTWLPAVFNVQVGNDDEYQASFTAPAPGTYSYTTRVSRDGTNWTYCDSNGAGSNPGLDFAANVLGTLTVP